VNQKALKEQEQEQDSRRPSPERQSSRREVATEMSISSLWRFELKKAGVKHQFAIIKKSTKHSDERFSVQLITARGHKELLEIVSHSSLEKFADINITNITFKPAPEFDSRESLIIMALQELAKYHLKVSRRQPSKKNRTKTMLHSQHNI